MRAQVCSVDIMICSLALSWTSDSRDDEHRSSLHLHSNVFLGSKDATADLAEDPVPRLLFDEHGQVKSDRRSVAMAAGWLEDQRRRANSLEVSAPTIAVVDLSARDKDEDAIDRAL